MACSVKKLICPVEPDRVARLPVAQTLGVDGGEDALPRLKPANRNPLRPGGKILYCPGAAMSSAVNVVPPKFDVVGAEKDELTVLFRDIRCRFFRTR